jgi:hypothetical protein
VGRVAKILLVAAVYVCDMDGRVSLDHDFPSRERISSHGRHSVLTAFESWHRFSIRELCSLALITDDDAIAEFLLFYVGRSTAVRRILGDLGLESTWFGDTIGEGHTTVADVLILIQMMSRKAHYRRILQDLRAITAQAWIGSARHLSTPEADSSLDLPIGNVYVLGRRFDLTGVVLCDSGNGASVSRREIDMFVNELMAAAEPQTQSETINRPHDRAE